MEHHFDVDIAVRYGINAAILLNNIAYWVRQNEANETNYFDGTYWTYNSRRAYKEMFPYMSERQINTAMSKLIDDGVIITGNYNQNHYDRTLWYALTEKGKSILHFDIIKTAKMSNENRQNVRPIPDNKPDIKPNNKTQIDISAPACEEKASHCYTDVTEEMLQCNEKKEPKRKGIDYEHIKEMFNSICKSFPKVSAMSEKRKQAIRARLNTYTVDQFKEMFEKAEKSNFLKGANNRNWSANFDWLMKDANFAKVLDGNYDNAKNNTTSKPVSDQSKWCHTAPEDEFNMDFWGK